VNVLLGKGDNDFSSSEQLVQTISYGAFDHAALDVSARMNPKVDFKDQGTVTKFFEEDKSIRLFEHPGIIFDCLE
jgi:hypothetical protein